MATFCINPKYVLQLKSAIKSGEINAAKLKEMTSEQRRELFSKHTTPEIGKQINTAFERAISSKQKESIKKWIKETFTTVQKNQPSHQALIERIDKVNEIIDAKKSDSFLEDVIADKLGISVSAEEVEEITRRTEELNKLYEPVKDVIGDPTQKQDEQKKYLEALSKTNDYLLSLTPSSKGQILSSIIGRGNLLFRASSAVINAVSDVTWGGYQAIERRIKNGSIGGANTKLARQIAAFYTNLYHKTGFDLSRSMTLDDTKKILGEEMIHSQGKGAIRAVGRFYTDVVFNKMQGSADVLGANIAFADSLNMHSTLRAKEEGLKGDELKVRAEELMKDAARVEPQSEEAKILREKAITDAQISTFTDKSTFAEISTGFRKALNAATGDLRLGDQLIPFVKTTSNIAQRMAETSGLGLIPSAVFRTIKTFNDVSKGAKFNEARKEEFKGFLDQSIRAGFGITVAFLLSMMIDEDDFLGLYDQKEKELNKLGNRINNAVRIGDKWVSLDYFGPLAAPITAMLYVKKYGGDLQNKAYNFFRGAASQATQIPGFEQVADAYKVTEDFLNDKYDKEKGGEFAANTIDQIRARLIPGIVSDFGKMVDDYQRETKGQGTWAKFQSNIPFLREKLPIAKDLFGEELYTESALSTLGTGSRVKQARDSSIIDELDRLSRADQLPTLTRLEETSTKMQRLAEQKGQNTYLRAAKHYQDTFHDKLQKTIRTTKYRAQTDEEKKNMINDLRNDVLESTLKKFGYKAPPKKKKK